MGDVWIGMIVGFTIGVVLAGVTALYMYESANDDAVHDIVDIQSCDKCDLCEDHHG